MSFYPVLLYIVCIFLRPQDWISFFQGKGIIFLLSIVSIFLLFFEKMLSREKDKFAKVPQSKIMVWMYLSLVLSHLSHFNLGGLMNVLDLRGVIANFILYYLIINSVNTMRKFKIITWTMVILIFILVFHGIQQMETGVGWANQTYYVEGGSSKDYIFRIRWIGIFEDPNDLGLAFVIASGIVLAFLFGTTGVMTKVMNMYLLGMLFYGIYLTNSRGALLALLTTVYFYFVRRTNKIMVGSVIGGILGSAFLLVAPSRMGMMSVSEASAFSRVELWYGGISMLKSNPFFGVGYGLYTWYMPQTAHSSFILAAGELGLLGLTCWMALIYTSFNGLLAIQHTGDKRFYNYALGYQSSIVGFCAAAFFLSRTYTVLPYLLFALSGALMNLARAKNSSLKYEFGKKELKKSFMLGIGVLLLSYSVIKFAL